MAEANYPYVLKVDGLLDGDASKLKKELFEHFGDLCDIGPHDNEISSYLVYHRNKIAADFLVREQFLWIDSNNKKIKLTFSVPREYLADNGDEERTRNSECINFEKSYEEYSEQETLGLQQVAERRGNGLASQGMYGKTKLYDLKNYENRILYNIKFIEHLANHELVVKHKSPDKAPVLIGPPNSATQAELKVMKFLRTIQKEDIYPRNEIIDEVKQSRICNKIISSLNERFQNEPVAFENNNGCIEAYFTEAKANEDIQKYLKDNLYQEYIPVNDVHKFEFIKKNLSKDIEKLIESKDFMIIFPENKSTDQGYSIVAFGNKTDFDNSKVELQKLIDCVESSEVTLNVDNVSENLKTFITGIEYRWDVGVNHSIINAENPRSAIINGVIVTLVKGRIEDQDVDVLVNSTGPKFQLLAGPLSKAINKKAGPELQIECSTKGLLNLGQVIATKGYNLSCKLVFHCLAKEWIDDDSENCKQILTKVITTCLEMANHHNLTSIAFPPIACGVLKMPAKISADVILGAIGNYGWTNHHTLKNIRLTIYEPWDKLFQVFQKSLVDKLNEPNSAWQRSRNLKVSIIGSNKDNIKKAQSSLLSAPLQ